MITNNHNRREVVVIFKTSIKVCVIVRNLREGQSNLRAYIRLMRVENSRKIKLGFGRGRVGFEMDPEKARQISAESAAQLQEGISLLLSRWSALQMAVENEWGGHDSRLKSHQLASDIFSWLTQSKGILIVHNLM